jgi:hypothetical protein
MIFDGEYSYEDMAILGEVSNSIYNGFRANLLLSNPACAIQTKHK